MNLCDHCKQFHDGAPPSSCFVNVVRSLRTAFSRLDALEGYGRDFVEVPWPRFRLECPSGHSTADHQFFEVKP